MASSCKNTLNAVKAVPITRVKFIVCNYGNRSYGVSYSKFTFNNVKTKSQNKTVKRRLSNDKDTQTTSPSVFVSLF